MVRILLVDNDSALRRTLRNSLAAHGYTIGEARSGEEALEAVTQENTHLILLDINMPGIGGLVTCRRLRAMTPQAGIIMVTVCDTEDDKVKALEAGADDYLTKPFSFRELLARLRAITRRLHPEPHCGTILRAGDIELDTDRRRLRRAGVEIRLSPTEFALLTFLMQHANVPVEHARLLRAVWGPEYGSELEYLRTYIKRLRNKIEPDTAHPEYLLTVPWIGYRFCDRSREASAREAGPESASLHEIPLFTSS
ncbi:MAG: response regulator transcription factor [Acidobacteriia bacterium]|nr:response regulator transcription factor [Terriglobia bacterium]